MEAAEYNNTSIAYGGFGYKSQIRYNLVELGDENSFSINYTPSFVFTMDEQMFFVSPIFIKYDLGANSTYYSTHKRGISLGVGYQGVIGKQVAGRPIVVVGFPKYKGKKNTVRETNIIFNPFSNKEDFQVSISFNYYFNYNRQRPRNKKQKIKLKEKERQIALKVDNYIQNEIKSSNPSSYNYASKTYKGKTISYYSISLLTPLSTKKYNLWNNYYGYKYDIKTVRTEYGDKKYIGTLTLATKKCIQDQKDKIDAEIARKTDKVTQLNNTIYKKLRNEAFVQSKNSENLYFIEERYGFYLGDSPSGNENSNGKYVYKIKYASQTKCNVDTYKERVYSENNDSKINYKDWDMKLEAGDYDYKVSGQKVTVYSVVRVNPKDKSDKIYIKRNDVYFHPKDKRWKEIKLGVDDYIGKTIEDVLEYYKYK